MKKVLALILAVAMLMSFAVVSSAKKYEYKVPSYNFREDGPIDAIVATNGTELGASLLPGWTYTYVLLEGYDLNDLLDIDEIDLDVNTLIEKKLVEFAVSELDDADEMVEIRTYVMFDELRLEVKVADKHLAHPSNFSAGVKVTLNLNKLKAYIISEGLIPEEAAEALFEGITEDVGTRPSATMMFKYWPISPDDQFGGEIFNQSGDREEVTLTWTDDIEFEVELDISEKAKNVRFTDAPAEELIDTYFDTPMSFYTFPERPKFNNVGVLSIYTEDDEVEYFLYAVDADGYLSEIANSTFEEGTFTIKTRTLGAYVVSEAELDIDAYNEYLKSLKAETPADPAGNPNTGR